MLINNRVIHNDNGTLRDLSKSLNNVFSISETFAYVAAQDKLYLGSDFPFNHRYFMIDTSDLTFNNENASVASVDIWDGDEWVPAVDVIDQTIDAEIPGCSLSQSGILSWVTDRNENWALEETTEDMTGSGLETLKIYDKFWVRVSWSADFTTTTKLKYVGHKFSSDEDLGGYYPDLLRANVMSAFKALKDNWDEQHVLAAETIISDLKKKNVILSSNQILEWDLFTNAAVHKVAEIAYVAFGPEYDERRETAQDNYREHLSKIIFPVDKNADGKIDRAEKQSTYGSLIRR